MKRNNEGPQTLLEVIRVFSDEQAAFECVRDHRWPDGKVICQHCGSYAVTFMAKRRVWNCKDCRKQFSAKTGSILEDSPLPFSKWLPAMWLLANCKNGISSYELHRDLGVTQKTAWFMLQRLRLALKNGSFEKLGDDVEADETFVGGLSKNMHKAEREMRFSGGRGGTGKAVVLGILERGGEVRGNGRIGSEPRNSSAGNP